LTVEMLSVIYQFQVFQPLRISHSVYLISKGIVKIFMIGEH